MRAAQRKHVPGDLVRLSVATMPAGVPCGVPSCVSIRTVPAKHTTAHQTCCARWPHRWTTLTGWVRWAHVATTGLTFRHCAIAATRPRLREIMALVHDEDGSLICVCSFDEPCGCGTSAHYLLPAESGVAQSDVPESDIAPKGVGRV